MTFPDEILTYDEQVIFSLRALYAKHGYACFKPSRFEEYELYEKNRAFLPAGNLIVFNSVGGKLMAMRPDVTLSIIKGIEDDGGLKKLCYNENVYRTVDGDLREQMQVGLECIGNIDTEQTGRVLKLAKQSLDTIGGRTRLDISHMGFLSGLLGSARLTPSQKAEVVRCISEKNAHGLKHICDNHRLGEVYLDELTALTSLYGPFSDIKPELERISVNSETDAALREITDLDDVLRNLGISDDIYIDFSVVNNITYYNGFIFHGFIEGIPSVLLSGGRYDKLVRSFGKNGGAIGFAIYLDLVSPPAKSTPDTDSDTGSISNDSSRGENQQQPQMLGIALPKGRLGEQALDIFKKAGYDFPDMSGESRKLVYENTNLGVRFFWVKPSDVAVYVERGAADIGVVGKDTLLETRRDVYELLDLGLGKCRMCVAGKADAADIIGSAGVLSAASEPGESSKNSGRLRVATKFPNIARDHFAGRGIDIDIISLHGSIELAPLLGLSDVIVDLVETGQTLADNEMAPLETIADISARLISNKASYRFKHEAIDKLCSSINNMQR